MCDGTLSVTYCQLRVTPRARAQWWLHIVVSLCLYGIVHIYSKRS